MTDDQRPELEWPSEDLTPAGKRPEPKPEVEWPSEDVVRTSQVPTEPPAPAAQPTPPPAAPEPAAPAPPPSPAAPEPPAPAAQPTPPAEPAALPPQTPPTPADPPVQAVPQPPVVPQPPAVPPESAPVAPPAPPAPEFVPAAEPTAPSPPPQPELPSYQPPPEPVAPRQPAEPYVPPVQETPAIPSPPEAAAYQVTPEPVAPRQPADPYDLPRGEAQPGSYVPPPEYQQLPGESPFAEQPGYDTQQQPGYGAPQQPHGSAYGTQQQPYQNQYAEPSEAMEPGPYGGAGVTVATAGAPPETEDTAEEGKSYFRKDIEGLRAVAVLAVLLFHVGVPYFDGGFVGVDVFYVISGFLITGLLLREGEETGKVDLLRFYARRMRRLLPAALLVIVVTLALSSVIVSPLRLTEIAGDAAASALYVANFHFAFEATDYLATIAPSPLLHYWSLGVEEQFYLFWPLILLLAVRFLPGRLVGIFVLVLAIASFALSLYWTSTLPVWAFFSPVTRAWELAAGALIAIGLVRLPQRAPSVLGSVAVVIGLLLIAAAVFMGGVLAELGLGDSQIATALFATADSPFPGVAALLPVLGTVLVIMGGSHSRTLVGRFVLGNPLSRYIGRISYSLYLWHWPILILIPIQLGVDDLATRLMLAGASIVLAILSTELWERPWRRSGALDKRTGGSVRLGLVGSVGVGVTALFMAGSISLPSDIELPWIQPPKVVAELAGVRDDLPRSYADDCHLVGYNRTRLTTDCIYGDAEGEQTAVLIGDSHAAQWLPALDAYASEQGWRLENFTKAACAVIDVPVWERSQRSTFERCINWREKVLKHIRETNPDVVYVGLSRDYELWDGTVKKSSDFPSYWGDRLTEYLATIGKPAGEVVLLAETPFLPYDPVDCLADDDIRNCDPSTRRVVDADYAALERSAANDSGAELLSINELLCDDSTCPVVVDDVVVFRDNHHLTASYMARLAEPIGNLLEGRPAYPTPVPTLAPASPAADAA